MAYFLIRLHTCMVGASRRPLYCNSTTFSKPHGTLAATHHSLSPCKQPRQLLRELFGTHVHLQAICRERLTMCHTHPQRLPIPTTVVVPSWWSSPLLSTVLFIACTAIKPPSPHPWSGGMCVCVTLAYGDMQHLKSTNQMLYTGIVSFIVWIHHIHFLEGEWEMV